MYVFHLLSRECTGNKDMWGDTGIGAVIHGRVRTCNLCFTYTPVFTDSLVLVDNEPTN